MHCKINMANSLADIHGRNFINLNKGCCLYLYKQLVRSHLKYAHSVWSPYKLGLIKKIEAVQRRSTKLVLKCAKLKYIYRLNYLKLPTLIY